MAQEEINKKEEAKQDKEENKEKALLKENPQEAISSLEKDSQSSQDKAIDKETKEMLEAGLHFGHKKSKKHPKMADFIYGTRNNIDIIDLLTTKECLKKTLDYLAKRKKEGALILFVGTKASAKDLIRDLAEEIKIPHVTERWLGGILTNFDIISKRINHLKELEEKMEKGEFKDLTKKERLRISQEVERIKGKIGGLKNLSKLPDLLFVVDLKESDAAVKEARIKGIPVVGICDTDGDPSLADHIIPANDDAISSLKYILNKVKEALS